MYLFRRMFVGLIFYWFGYNLKKKTALTFTLMIFVTEHVFSNMCRALPWRQVHGDICYVLVRPHDGDRFCVTAATYGCFVNEVSYR